MAAYSLFEEDEVCYVTPDKTYIYGMVMENYETASSDEEDYRPDICKKGCVLIAWHPKGKESEDLPEKNVLLADRTLNPTDVVRRLVVGQDTQCGLVQDMEVICHLHITGTDKYIYNVNSKLLSPCIPLQKFDVGYVSLDTWLGRVEEVTELITLVFPDGARCEADDTELCCLEDITENRQETAIYNEEYWYRGQQLKGVMSDLRSVTWLNSTQLYNTKNVQNKKNSTIYATVEKVKIRSIYVHWLCRGYSKVCHNLDSYLQPPPRELVGADIDRLQLVDWFEHCSMKLGDKMFYTIREEDVLETQQPKHRFVPYAVQAATPERLAEVTHRTEDMISHRCENGSKLNKRKGSKKSLDVTLPSESSSKSTASLVASSGGTTVNDVTMAAEGDSEKAEEKTWEFGKGDGELDEDADDEYEDIEESEVKVAGSGSDAGSITSASETKRRKRDKGHCLPRKSKSSCLTPSRPVSEIPLIPGSQVATEISYKFSFVTVIWQDGSVEERIPSIELYPMHHLDELEFFPGSFVVDSKAEDISNEYGVVMSCNHFERTCQIKWLKPYEFGKACFPTEVIKASEVSVYDIADHPDYRFRPGNCVIRVAGFQDMEQTLQAVGQVISLNPDGTIIVHWCDGSSTSSYPQDLYIVWDMSDYSNSSWDSLSSSSPEEDDSEQSWVTEEEEEEEVGEGEVDGDADQSDEEGFVLKNMREEQRTKVYNLLEKAQEYFHELNDLYTVHTAALAESRKVATNTVNEDVNLIRCLNDVLKIYRSCRKLDRILKTYYFSTPEVTNLVATIKGEIKKEKTNKIKHRLEQVFESCNKVLLESKKIFSSETPDDAETTCTIPAAETEADMLGDVKCKSRIPQDYNVFLGILPSKNNDQSDETNQISVVITSNIELPQSGSLPMEVIYSKCNDAISACATASKSKEITSEAEHASTENVDTGSSSSKLVESQDLEKHISSMLGAVKVDSSCYSEPSMNIYVSINPSTEANKEGDKSSQMSACFSSDDASKNEDSKLPGISTCLTSKETSKNDSSKLSQAKDEDSTLSHGLACHSSTNLSQGMENGDQMHSESLACLSNTTLRKETKELDSKLSQPLTCLTSTNLLEKADDEGNKLDQATALPPSTQTNNFSNTLLNIVQLCGNLCKSIQENIDIINSALDTTKNHLQTSVDKVLDGERDQDSKVRKRDEKKLTSPLKLESLSQECKQINGCLESVDLLEKEEGAQDTLIEKPDDSSNIDGADNSEVLVQDGENGETDETEPVTSRGFQMCSAAPQTHKYIDHVCLPVNPRTFYSAIRKELKLLKTTLPDGIIVKGYENRMDLFSVLIEGPVNTPYEGGLFLFDVMLPEDYPTSPPILHFHSYSQDRLNPNLYADGKVCVSLLGTWSGKGMEVWTEKSNLLQVLISIQGLILVDEPYYNEAGYERQRGQQIARENSRLYNEMAILKLVQSMTAMMSAQPEPFTQEVQEFMLRQGPKLKERLLQWMTLSENMGDRQGIQTTSDCKGAASSPLTAVVNGDSSAFSNSSVELPNEFNYALDNSENLCAPPVESSSELCSPIDKSTSPTGHPDFPLLPMSKGFRLTLQKSLTQFEQALGKLHMLAECVDLGKNGVADLTIVPS